MLPHKPWPGPRPDRTADLLRLGILQARHAARRRRMDRLLFGGALLLTAAIVAFGWWWELT